MEIADPLSAPPVQSPFFRDSHEWHLMRRIVREHGVVHARSYVVIASLMAVASGCTAAAAYILGNVINSIYVHKQFSQVVALAAAMMLLSTVRGFASYGQAVLLARIGNRIVAETQRRLIEKLLRQSLSFLSAVHSSEIAARASNGSSAATNILNLLTLTLGRDLLTLSGLAVVMLREDPLLTIIGFGVMPLAAIGVRELLKRSSRVAKHRFSATAAIMKILQETVQGIRVVKAFNLEDQTRRRTDREIENVAKASNKLARLSNQSSPLTEALAGIAVALVLLYSGYRVVLSGDEPGRFVSFLAAFLLAFDPARRIARLRLELNSKIIAAQTIFDLIDAPETEPDDSDKPPLAVREGRVTFADVVFAYRPDAAVLRGVSFAAEPNETTALVGPSGGGKSTALSLLLRFYEPQSGAIAIDGQDISEVSRRSLRGQLAYVGQDVFLFHGTIRENIEIGREGSSQAEVEAAAKAAFAHDFIMSFPKGYESSVGEFGWQLSLGQRQRISIARAFLKGARIVLLDEPTSSLDSESEEQVQRALRRLCAGRTTIMIAHRLTTVRRADCIHVIENGVIAESGREDDLLTRNGLYAKLFRLQFSQRGGSEAAIEHSSLTPIDETRTFRPSTARILLEKSRDVD
jgi:ATP-binding cassette, subfamily B, bacterial MsbA